MRKKKDICNAVRLFRFLNFKSHEFIELRRAFVLIQWLNTMEKMTRVPEYNVCRANNRAVISIIENDSLGCWSYNLLLKQFL